MNRHGIKSSRIPREDDESTLESKNEKSSSFELTPANIANERLRQMERELREQYKEEEQHPYNATTDTIRRPGKLKDDKKYIERNIQGECRSGTKTNGADLRESQTMDRQESIHGNTANRRDATLENCSSFELTPENIANERLKQIEREARLSEQDTNVSIKQVKRSPPTKTVSGSHAEKEERDVDSELDSQKPSRIASTNIGKLKQSHNDTRANADSVGSVNQIPGAFAIRGISAAIGDDDIYDSTNYSQRSPPPSKEIFAETVDDEELATQYSHKAKEKMREKIKAEAATATKIHLSDKDKETSNMTYCKRLALVFVTISTIVLGLSLGLSNARKKSVMTRIPSSPPTLEPSLSGFSILQDQLWSISGDAVFNSSSPQYKALEWLAYEDTFFLDCEYIKSSSLSVRYALSVLYFSTNGTNWGNNTQFLTNESVCEWQFIDCDVTESVVKINMDNNKLDGEIPSELVVVSSMESISFRNNHLRSTIPHTIGNLSRLKYIDASLNYLTGSIPDSFSQLTRLKVLSLGENMLSGNIPHGLVNIETLEVIEAQENFLSGIIPSFSQRNFEVIELWNNQLDGSIPDSIMTLKNLEFIDLMYNMITGTIPSEIKEMEKLVGLYLDYNNLSGTIPTTFGELEYLEDIWLSGNSLNGTIPSELGLLTELIYFGFEDNHLTGTLPTELGQLSSVFDFYINDNNITGTVPLSFSKLTKLESFSITNTSIHGSLDVVFCYPFDNNIPLLFLEADCGESPFPEVNCTCCTKCCNDDSYDCEINSAQICQNYVNDFESVFEGAICTCDETHSSMSCNYIEDCQTCNEDKTVCGTSSDFGVSNWESNTSIFTNTFAYEIGRNDTIQWEESKDELGFPSCWVNVNGGQCDICTYTFCDDGYMGLFIDCTNIVEGDSGVYDSCNLYEEGGVFDVLSWEESLSWTGCPFDILYFWPDKYES